MLNAVYCVKIMRWEAIFIDVAMAYDIIIEMALFGTMGSVVMGEILLIHHKAIDTKDIT